MGKFIVNGGRRLHGEVEVSGSKNAALPIIFASLITHGVSEIRNLPDITDVKIALMIIEQLGARVSLDGGVALIDTRSLEYRSPSAELVSCLRASTYLIGAGLVRFCRAELLPFGGCNFSHRPIDIHLAAAESFGAVLDGGTLTADTLHPAEITLAKKSVGATVNSLILAAGTKGESRIRGYAIEPHILTLIEYLRSAGAVIEPSGDALRIVGGHLHGGSVSIPGDMIEAGTYLAASLVTGGDVTVTGFFTDELCSFIDPLCVAGVRAEGGKDWLRLSGAPRRKMDIVTAAYPGFPTDLQPIFSVLMAKFHGGTVRETVWQGRFGYLSELAKLGLSYSLDTYGASIHPSHPLSGTMRATDLRGGAAGLLFALAAEGQSEICSGEVILRGYERPIEKLRELGAEIGYV